MQVEVFPKSHQQSGHEISLYKGLLFLYEVVKYGRLLTRKLAHSPQFAEYAVLKDVTFSRIFFAVMPFQFCRGFCGEVCCEAGIVCVGIVITLCLYAYVPMYGIQNLQRTRGYLFLHLVAFGVDTSLFDEGTH